MLNGIGLQTEKAPATTTVTTAFSPSPRSEQQGNCGYGHACADP